MWYELVHVCGVSCHVLGLSALLIIWRIDVTSSLSNAILVDAWSHSIVCMSKNHWYIFWKVGDGHQGLHSSFLSWQIGRQNFLPRWKFCPDRSYHQSALSNTYPVHLNSRKTVLQSRHNVEYHIHSNRLSCPNTRWPPWWKQWILYQNAWIYDELPLYLQLFCSLAMY